MKYLRRRGGGSDEHYEKRYLTFKPLEDATFSFTNPIYYSIDNGHIWRFLDSGSPTPTLSKAFEILWKGNLVPEIEVGIGTFSATGDFEVSGNIMSLYYGDDFADETVFPGQSNACYGLFAECQHLISAENLVIPAEYLREYELSGMFYGCTSLEIAPKELPTTILAEGCYDSMFNSCTSLVNAPKLPATILANYCYSAMFYNCTSLTTAPELPATILADFCYQHMFDGCTSLVEVLELPATTLSRYCYELMFNGCTSLSYIKCLATDISAYNCTSAWLNNVSPTGTFVKDASMQDWGMGGNGIPSGWTVEDA